MATSKRRSDSIIPYFKMKKLEAHSIVSAAEKVRNNLP